MKVLVTGKVGQVVTSLQQARWRDGVEIIAAGRPELDLADAASIEAAVARITPDVVVHAAGYTAVDKAETEAGLAFAINGEGAGHVARVCERHGIPIIHLSTDYVFDGQKSAPYVETDSVAPLGVYGRSKLEGERLVAAHCTRHIILRTSWVVSPFGHNFVKTMLRLAETRPELGVVDDQFGAPTFASHLADAIMHICGRLQDTRDSWGIYHASGAGEASWCEVAREVFACSAALSGKVASVKPITTAEYPTPAKRPKNSRLDCCKLEHAFGLRLPPWQEGISACVRAVPACDDDRRR